MFRCQINLLFEASLPFTQYLNPIWLFSPSTTHFLPLSSSINWLRICFGAQVCSSSIQKNKIITKNLFICQNGSKLIKCNKNGIERLVKILWNAWVINLPWKEKICPIGLINPVHFVRQLSYSTLFFRLNYN